MVERLLLVNWIIIMSVGKIGLQKYRGHVSAFNHQRQVRHNCGNDSRTEMMVVISRINPQLTLEITGLICMWLITYDILRGKVDEQPLSVFLDPYNEEI